MPRRIQLCQARRDWGKVHRRCFFIFFFFFFFFFFFLYFFFWRPQIGRANADNGRGARWAPAPAKHSARELVSFDGERSLAVRGCITVGGACRADVASGDGCPSRARLQNHEIQVLVIGACQAATIRRRRRD